MKGLSREDFKRDELRYVWEQKELVSSQEAVAARRQKAIERLLSRGQPEPTIAEIEEVRYQIEEEAFRRWLAGKRLTGFDGV